MAEVTTGTPFRSVRNFSGTQIGANLFVSQDTANYHGVVLPAAVTTLGYGATTEAIPDQGAGSVLVEGVAQVLCSAAVNIGDMLQSGVDGRCALAVTSSVIRGRAMSATTGANQLVEVELWEGRFIAP